MCGRLRSGYSLVCLGLGSWGQSGFVVCSLKPYSLLLTRSKAYPAQTRHRCLYMLVIAEILLFLTECGQCGVTGNRLLCNCGCIYKCSSSHLYRHIHCDDQSPMACLSLYSAIGLLSDCQPVCRQRGLQVSHKCRAWGLFHSGHAFAKFG